jgi:hypothetical protein
LACFRSLALAASTNIGIDSRPALHGSHGTTWFGSETAIALQNTTTDKAGHHDAHGQ